MRNDMNEFRKEVNDACDMLNSAINGLRAAQDFSSVESTSEIYEEITLALDSTENAVSFLQGMKDYWAKLV